jgi:hypothetical protein
VFDLTVHAAVAARCWGEAQMFFGVLRRAATSVGSVMLLTGTLQLGARLTF